MRKYWAYTRMNLYNTFIDRGSMLVYLIGNMIFTITFTSLWRASQADGLIGGYTKPELAAYYIVSLFLQWLVLWYPFGYVFGNIRDGTIILSALSKPISFYKSVFFIEIGWHLISSLVGLIASFLITYLLKENLVLNLPSVNFVLLLPAVIFSILITFSLSLNMGLLAFWFTEIGAIESFFWIGRSVLGGAVIPISFIPSVFQLVIKLLPFRYTFSFPLEIIFNKVSLNEAFEGLLISFFWVVVLVRLYHWLWENGRKAYTAFGQ